MVLKGEPMLVWRAVLMVHLVVHGLHDELTCADVKQACYVFDVLFWRLVCVQIMHPKPPCRLSGTDDGPGLRAATGD